MGLSSTTNGDDSNWEFLIEDEGNQQRESQSLELLLQRIIKLENCNKPRDQRIKALENERKNVNTAAEIENLSLKQALRAGKSCAKFSSSSFSPIFRRTGSRHQHSV